MQIITKEFTYDVPNVYLSTDTSEGKTGTVSYHGPDEIYVFVDKKTGKLNWSMHCLINHDETIYDLAQIHAGEDHRPILVTFDQNPLICWAMWGVYDEENASETTYTLEGETEPYFSHFDPIPPHEVYDYPEFTFLFDNAAWKTPYPMRSPQRTQDEWTEIFNGMIADAQACIDAEDVNDDDTAAMIAYKEELEALPTRFADVPWYMWKVPAGPDITREDHKTPEGIVTEEEWVPAEDGSEGPGPATNYQPADETVIPANESAEFPNTESSQPPADPPEDSEE